MAETARPNGLQMGSIPSVSVRIIALAIVFACLYYASTLVITLICSILLAFVLEPGVRLMERLRVPRWLGSLLMVLLTLAAVYLIIYAAYDRIEAFVNDLPRFASRIKQLVAQIQVTAKSIRQSTSDLLPTSPEAAVPAVRLQQESPWVQFLLRGIGSVYAFAVTVMFIPFLVFFMLASRHQIWVATLNLFPIDRRQEAEDVIRGITQMVREFVVGNFLVWLASALMITPVLWLIQLRYAVLMGPLAAALSMIPYIGVALALLPPLLIALVQYFESVGPFVTIALTVVGVHFIAVNLLTPKLVGKRVKLNALTVTISMMFWGWLWGAVGLVLAIPITAAIKAICDHVDRLKPYGAWMGHG